MKNIRKIVAAALVTFQVILTAAVGFIPASAEAGTQGNAYSYQVYKADAPITVDGAVTEGEAWTISRGRKISVGVGVRTIGI